MKPLLLVIASFLVLVYAMIQITFSVRSEYDFYTDLAVATSAFSGAYSGMCTSFISMGRILHYVWLRTGRHILNSHFVLNKEDAEYFFFKEQEKREDKVNELIRGDIDELEYFGKKFTSADAAEKYEYYCRTRDPGEMMNYCMIALQNEGLAKKINWKMSSTQSPQCEFRLVQLPRYEFESWRMFLMCPVSAARTDKPNHPSRIYLSSVENAPWNRLLAYVFMLNPPEPIGESSQSPSVSEFEDTASNVSDDRSSLEEVETTPAGLAVITEVEGVEGIEEIESRGTSRDGAEVTDTPRSDSVISIRDNRSVHSHARVQRVTGSSQNVSSNRDRKGRKKRVQARKMGLSLEAMPLQIVTLIINRRHNEI